MKARLMLFLMLVTTVTIWGQTASDQLSVIELSLNMAEMNPNDHLDNNNIPVLVIVDNGVLPQGIALTYFGNPVVLKSAQQIATEGISAYLQFDAFGVTSSTEAHATFTYYHGTNQGRSYQLGFSYLSNLWYVDQKQITHF
jgi:hypothetical protein